MTEAFILFPSGGIRSMKDEYPELAKVQEFERLNADELKFVWYYSSFYQYHKSETERIKLSVESAFLKFGRWSAIMDAKMRAQYLEGNFPEDIRLAITKMGSYDLEARVASKLMAEATLKTYQYMISSINDDIINEKMDIDWDKRKKQVDTMATINKELPNILSQVETGYGVRKVKLDKGDYIQGLDKWHENNK